MRIATLVCASALALAASEPALLIDASAQIVPAGMGGGGPSGGVPVGEMKPSVAPERDPAEQSAKSIECAQKADVQGLQGKDRKRFLHKCRSGVV